MKRLSTPVVPAILIALFIMVGSCTAALAQDRDICLQRDGTRSIEACSRVIDAGQIKGKDLATIYVLRATLYRSNQQYDRAIDDITHAIDLLTNLARSDVIGSAYATRASVYSLNGDPAKALADYERALSHDPSNVQAADEAKRLRSQLASTTAQKSGLSANKIEAPNQPMPSEVQIPNNILQLVQTDPFFANPPPVRVGTFETASSYSISTSAGPGSTSLTSDDKVFVSWLRAGIARIDESFDSTSRGLGFSNPEPSAAQTEAISAGDGFLQLGSRSTGSSRFGSSTTTLKIVRLNNLSGHLFPMQLGNRFSYKYINQQNTTMSGKRTSFEYAYSDTCSVIKQYEAKLFHPDLTGVAFLIECANQMSTVSSTISGPVREVFFEDLGYWISADPIILKEQIISNGAPSIQTIKNIKPMITSSITGTYTLRSFSLVR